MTSELDRAIVAATIIAAMAAMSTARSESIAEGQRRMIAEVAEASRGEHHDLKNCALVIGPVCVFEGEVRRIKCNKEGGAGACDTAGHSVRDR